MRKIRLKKNKNEVLSYPEDMYCVYFHRDPETLDVVYVGKGTLHRPFQINLRTLEHHKWLVEKLEKFEVQEIVEIKGGNMTAKEALTVEAHEIKCCLRKGCNLFNVEKNPYRRTKNANSNKLLNRENKQELSRK